MVVALVSYGGSSSPSARLGGVARGQQVQRTDAAAICEAGGT